MAKRQIVTKIAGIVPQAEKIMHMRWPILHWPVLRNAALVAVAGAALCGCDSALEPFVGQSKEAAANSKPQAPPPAPPPTAAFVSDSDLVPGYVGHTILPPTLATADTDDDSDSDAPAASTGPHRAIVAVPLSSESTALAMLSAGVKREAAPAGTHFVLLVLSPPANDAASLDRTTNAAREAAKTAVKILGDAGVPADHVEVSMATSPNAGDGELRLYRR
jgi:hypothetical protein